MRVVKILLIVLILFVVGLTTLEWSLRSTDPNRDEREGIRKYIVADDNGFAIHKPNLDIEIEPYANPESVRIITNAEGFMGKDFPIDRHEGVVRIALMGDTALEAGAVNYDESFAYILEQLLNQKSDTRYEVLNFGMFDQSTVNQLVYYRNYVAKYNPDYVVLVFTTTDILKNQFYYDYEDQISDPDFDVSAIINSTANNVPERTDFKYRLFNEYKSVQFIDGLFRKTPLLSDLLISLGIHNKRPLGQHVTKENLKTLFFTLKEPLDAQFERGYQFSLSSVKRLESMSASDRSQFVFAYLPAPEQLYESIWEEQRNRSDEVDSYNWNWNQSNDFFLENLMASATIDFTRVMRDAYDSDQQYLHFDSAGEGKYNEDLNPVGHRLVASGLTDFFLDLSD